MLLFALLSSCGYNQKPAEVISQQLDSVAYRQKKHKKSAIEIDKYFSKRHKKTQFYGNVLFAEKGKVIFAKSYGYKKNKNWPNVSLESTFQIASVTKTFTAVAILMLHEQGLINIDDSIKDE